METPIATLMDLAKTHRSALKARDSYIFKVLTSVLTLEAVFVAALLSKAYQLEGPHVRLCLSAAFWGLAIVTFYHLFVLHRANHTNKGIAEGAERLSLELLRDPKTEILLELTRRTYKGCHMWIWQSSFVAVGTFVITFFLLNV